MRIANRAVLRAVQRFWIFGLKIRLAVGSRPTIEPAAEPVGSGQAKLDGPRMRIGGLYGREFVGRAELLVALPDVIGGLVEARGVVLDHRQQRTRRDGYVQVAQIHAFERAGEDILLDIG